MAAFEKMFVIFFLGIVINLKFTSNMGFSFQLEISEAFQCHYIVKYMIKKFDTASSNWNKIVISGITNLKGYQILSVVRSFNPSVLNISQASDIYFINNAAKKQQQIVV